MTLTYAPSSNPKLVLQDAEAVWLEVQVISRLRGRHGYALVREGRGAAIGAEAA